MEGGGGVDPLMISNNKKRERGSIVFYPISRISTAVCHITFCSVVNSQSNKINKTLSSSFLRRDNKKQNALNFSDLLFASEVFVQYRYVGVGINFTYVGLY